MMQVSSRCRAECGRRSAHAHRGLRWLSRRGRRPLRWLVRPVALACWPACIPLGIVGTTVPNVPLQLRWFGIVDTTVSKVPWVLAADSAAYGVGVYQQFGVYRCVLWRRMRAFSGENAFTPVRSTHYHDSGVRFAYWQMWNLRYHGWRGVLPISFHTFQTS